jgi:hypothetical protein
VVSPTSPASPASPIIPDHPDQFDHASCQELYVIHMQTHASKHIHHQSSQAELLCIGIRTICAKCRRVLRQHPGHNRVFPHTYIHRPNAVQRVSSSFRTNPHVIQIITSSFLHKSTRCPANILVFPCQSTCHPGYNRVFPAHIHTSSSTYPRLSAPIHMSSRHHPGAILRISTTHPFSILNSIQAISGHHPQQSI